MNAAAQRYWEEFWKNEEAPQNVSAWRFGDTPNRLAQQVVERTKTATCSAYLFYQLENIPIPTTEDYGVILDHDENPVAIVKTIEVTIVPMNEITEEFAIAEGDGSYTNWKEIHERYFRSKLDEVDHEFSEDMLLVCERFRIIDVRR
ncbi:ASCH domain-containing protein [Bacillus cereus]|nr:ASCH domain-containing protein [Bacillus cereus]PGP86898.1 ASCH domain-containing protein [Bacillus cereus]